MRAIVVTIKDKLTGGLRKTEELPTMEGFFKENVEYLWSEGGYSCDCNRGVLFYNYKDIEKVPCGFVRFLIDVEDADTGEIIVQEID